MFLKENQDRKKKISWDNLYTKSVLPDIKFRFTYGESGMYVLKHCKVTIYYDQDFNAFKLN